MNDNDDPAARMAKPGYTVADLDVDPELINAEARAIVLACRPLLAGHHPGAIGAALAELTATFFASHHPSLRAELLDIHFNAVRELIGPCEQEIFSTRPRPEGWDDD